MPEEKMHIPDHSLICIIKFESDNERAEAINTEEYSQLFGKLGMFAINHNAQFISKTSKN
jgi:hypothetical protein